MSSRAKKRRALKRKEATAAAAAAADAAAARENTKNETPPTASSKENNPAIQTETTDGATAVFAEPTAVLPKRVVVLENILAPDVFGSEDKDSENSKENPLPTEIYSSVPASESQGTNEADELISLHLTYLNSIHKKMMERGYILPSDDTAFSVLVDNEMISVTPEPCDLDLVTAECSNSDNAVLIDVDVTEDQRIFAHKEDYAVEKNKDLVTPKNLVVAENQENAMTIEVNAAEKYQVVELDEVETAAKNQEAATSEEVKDTEKNILGVVRQEAVTATEPAVDVVQGPGHDAVSTQVITAEVLKQLNPMKELVEDVKKIVEDALNRLNAIAARLHEI